MRDRVKAEFPVMTYSWRAADFSVKSGINSPT